MAPSGSTRRLPPHFVKLWMRHWLRANLPASMWMFSRCAVLRYRRSSCGRLYFAHGGCRAQQLIERDRQFANTNTGRMENGIGDRRCHTNNAGLSQAFQAERIDNGIMLLDEDHFDITNVRVNWHVVLRQI